MTLFTIAGAVCIVSVVAVLAMAFGGARKLLSEVYERLVFWLLIFQYFFVNIAFSTYTQNIVLLKDIFAPLLSAIILAVWVLGDLAKHGKWELPKHGIVPVSVITLLWWAFSVYHAMMTPSALEEWGEMAGYFVEIWACIRFFDTVKKLETFAIWAFVTNILVTGYGLGQALGFDILVMLGPEIGIPDWGRNVYVSTHGNPNFFGGYLICSFPLLIGLWLSTRNPFLMLALPAWVLVNLFCVEKTDSRAAYIGVGVTMSVMVVGLLMNYRSVKATITSEHWKATVFKTSGVFAIVTLVVAAVFLGDDFFRLFSNIYNQMSQLTDVDKHFTNRARLVFWQMATDAIQLMPWTGRGIGGFNFYMPETRIPGYHRNGVSHNTDHPHNEYLEWLSDTGIPGLALFLLVLFIYLVTSYRECRRLKDSRLFPLLFVASLGPWAQWIQGAFDVETRWVGNGVTLWTGVGFALAFMNIPAGAEAPAPAEAAAAIQPQTSSKKRQRVSVAKEARSLSAAILPRSPAFMPVTVFFTVTLTFFGWMSWNWWMADHHLRNNMAWSEGSQNDNSRALDESLRSWNLNPHNISNYYKLAYAFLGTGKTDQAMESYRTLQAYAPNYAQIHVNLSYLNDQMGYRMASAWERERATAIEYNTRNCRDAAMYWAMIGHPMRSISHLRRALMIERDRNNGTYSYWMDHDAVTMELAQVYLNNGMAKRATAELRRAIQMNPGNVQAALAFVDLLRQQGENAEADRIVRKLLTAGGESGEVLILSAEQAIREKNWAAALDAVEKLVSQMRLPAPNTTVDRAFQAIGNSALSALQGILNAGHQPAKAIALAGWIKGCLGEYGESARFLAQAYAMTGDQRIAEQLGAVKARGGI